MTDADFILLLGSSAPLNAVSLSGVTVAENAANSATVGTATIVGIHSGASATWSITDASSTFAINSSTGAVTVSSNTAITTGTVSFPVVISAGVAGVPDLHINIGVTLVAPTLDLVASSDTGSSNTDNITSNNTPDIDITFALVLAGDIVDVKDGSTVIATHTITSGDISGSTVDLGLSALADGVHSLTARNTRSGVSSAYGAALSVTIDTVAPTLSAASGVQAAQTTANLSVSTNETTGVLYVVVTASATPPSKAQVKAGQNDGGTSAIYAANQSISSSGTKTNTATGLSVIQTDYAYWMHEDLAGNQSSVASTSWAQADITAPVLSSAAAITATSTTETLSVSTDTAEGTLYAIVSTVSSTPSAAQIKLGHDSTGGSSLWSGNQPVSSSGVQTMTGTGLSLSTNYYGFFVHTDVAGNNSTVASTGLFTTSSATNREFAAIAAYMNSQGARQFAGIDSYMNEV